MFFLNKLTLSLLWAIFFLINGFISITSSNSNSIQQYFFSQTLDHFGGGNLSQIKFNQKIFVDKTYWSGKKSAPMLIYFGGEGQVDYSVQRVTTINHLAPRFNALVLYIEHRFYGESIPFGDLDIAMGDIEVRGCLTSQQALVDFAEIIDAIRKSYLNSESKVVVIGCSYSGMLAAWFRLKFPHLAVGMLASSAPMFYFDMKLPLDYVYCDGVSNNFKKTNEICYERIKKSWEMIDNISLLKNGHDYLNSLFKTCTPYLFVEELKGRLVKFFWYTAQYNGANNYGQINKVCEEIVGASEDDILGGISRSILGGNLCLDLDGLAAIHTSPTSLTSRIQKAWNWQVCSEFIERLGCGNNTMFQPHPFNLTKRIEYCTSEYQVPPRPNWVSMYYGASDMRSTLKHFGSNMVFSNGLMDPLSQFGVLEDISHTVVALTTQKGSHCLDVGPMREDDPRWLKEQREHEENILAKWLKSSVSSNRPETRILLLCLTTLAFL